MVNLKKVVKGQLNTIKNIIDRQIHSFIDRKYPRPIYLSTHTVGKVKIHVGSGDINLQGWINMDARSMPHIHLVRDDLSFQEFTDGAIDEIYMCHILEHLSFQEVANTLATVKRKLKKGGVIRLSVPCFDSLVKIYSESGRNIDLIKFALMGGQDYQYNYHKSIYNYQSLVEILSKEGFKEVTKWDPLHVFGEDIGDWSGKLYETQAGKTMISLNLVARSA